MKRAFVSSANSVLFKSKPTNNFRTEYFTITLYNTERVVTCLGRSWSAEFFRCILTTVIRVHGHCIVCTEPIYIALLWQCNSVQRDILWYVFYLILTLYRATQRDANIHRRNIYIRLKIHGILSNKKGRRYWTSFRLYIRAENENVTIILVFHPNINCHQTNVQISAFFYKRSTTLLMLTSFFKFILESGRCF